MGSRKKKSTKPGRRNGTLIRRVDNLDSVTLADRFGNVIRVTFHRRNGHAMLELSAPKMFHIHHQRSLTATRKTAIIRQHHE